MYNHYGHPHYGHEQEPSQAQAYYPMDMHGHPVPGAPPPWNMQPHPHPGWQHDGAPSWQPPPWHAEPRPWHDPYEGRRGSIPHPQHDTHSTAWGHTRHSPAPQPPSHSQGEPHQRSSRTPGGRAATPGHSQHGDKSHSGRGGRADMGSASRGQQHGDRRRHDASPSRNLGRADRHVPVVLHGSNSPGSRERDRGSLDRNRSRDTGWDKGTGQQRQRGQHGSKPSWWVHPDLSKGFADIECRVKYDELPARLPAFLPGAAATGSKGSSGLHGEDGATAAAAANAAASPPPPPPPDPTQQTSASADIAVGQLHLDGPQVLPQEQPAAAAHGQAAGEASAAGLSPPARTAEGAAHDAGKPESQAQAGTGRLPAAGAEAVAGSPAAAAAAAAAVAAAGDASSRAQLPIILFDLNGTLTSHTFQRRSSGVTQVRPGVALLARTLAHKARIGIFSSATHRTVADARALIEEACEGTPLFEPGLILHREHTQPAPAHHIKAGGKAWDTVKPLGRWFKHLHRVLLVDDDNYKALPTERSNMVVVPCWEEERDCPVLQRLAEAFDQELSGLGPDADLRPVAAAVHARLFASNLLAEGAKETEHGATDDDDTASDNDRGNEEGSGDEEDGPQRKRARLQAPPECGAPQHAQHLITQLFPQQDQEQQQQEQEQQRQQQRQQQEQDQQQQQEQQLQQQVGAGTQVAADDEMAFIPVQPYQPWGDPLGVGSQPQQQRQQQQQQQHEGDTAAGAAPMLVDGPQSLKQGLKQLASLIREHPDSMAALAVAMDAVNAFKPVVSEAQPTLQANKMVVQQGTLIRAYPRCLALMEAVWSVPAPYPKTVVAVLAAFANSKRWKVQWEVPDVPVVPATDPGGAPLDTPAAAAKTSADYVGTCTVSSSKGVVLQVVRQAPFKKTAKAQAAAAAIEQLLQSGVSEAEMLAAVREDGKAAAPASGGAAAPAAAGAGGRGAGSKGAKAQKAKAQKAAAGPASNALAGNLAAGAGPSAMGGGSSGRQAAQQQQGSRQPSRGAQQQRQGLAGTSAAVLPPAAAGLPSSSASLPPAAAGLPSASAGPPHAGLWAGTSRSCMGSGYAFNVTAQGDVAPEADMDEDT